MRLAIFIVLLALTTSVSAGWAGWWGSSSIWTVSTVGAGWYSDPKLIVHYPLQSWLMIYKLTAYKYWW